MFLPSEQYGLWHRLRERFRISGRSAGLPVVSNAIYPVTVADNLLAVPAAYDVRLAGVGVSSNVVMFEVPFGKRWTVIALSIMRTSGSRQVDRVEALFFRFPGHPNITGPPALVLLIQDSEANASLLLPYPITLERGDVLRFATSDDGGSTASIYHCTVHVLEEDV